MIEHITTKVGKRTFTLERVFNAPRGLAFKAFTEPKFISRWWAPEPFTIPVCNIDLCEGGIWHYCMESPRGHKYWSRAVYQDIERPKRIIYDGSFADEEGNEKEGHPKHQAKVTFTELGDKTKISVEIVFDSTEDLERSLEMGMEEGLKMTLNDQLPKVLKEVQSA